jgi:AraC-like DNA-binding protein
MKPYILPQALYALDSITKILSDNDNAILHKKLNEDLIDAEKLIVSHSIVYVVYGKVRVNTYDGDEITIGNEEMLFMPRDSYLISDFITKDNGLEVFILFFTHEIVEKFLDGFHTDIVNKNTICKLTVTNNIKHYFNNIRQMDFKDSFNKSLLELKLLEFLHFVIDDQFKQTLFASEIGKQKRDIELLMLEHYDKNLTISDFADLSGRSLSTFNREFKRTHNKTPKQWLIEKKLSKAKELLDKGLSVTESAFEVGYHNVSHFIKAYKGIYGKTPKEMQKKIILN